MKIKDLEAKTIAIPLKDKLLNDVGEHPGRLIFTIVKIETDEGIIGYEETGGEDIPYHL
jgi:glucarate dehydratase